MRWLSDINSPPNASICAENRLFAHRVSQMQRDVLMTSSVDLHQRPVAHSGAAFLIGGALDATPQIGRKRHG